MHELWASASYEPHLLSLPFAFAPAAMLVVIVYAIVMRGAPTLRGWLLTHCVALLPYAAVMMLMPSTTSPAAAEQWFRFAASFIPLAAAAGTGFQLVLARKFHHYRVWVWLGVASAAAWIVIGSITTAAVTGVRWLPAGLWYADAGPYAWLALVHTFALSLPGFLLLGRAAIWGKPSDERRQLRLALMASLITYSGLIDVGLAYDIGVFPVGWLLSGIGSLLVLRALVVEDLLRVRAIDTAAPLVVALLSATIVLAWVGLSLLGPTATWWGITMTSALCFAGVRASAAAIALLSRGARRNEGPLDRLVGQLVTRARAQDEPTAIAQLAIDVVELGVGEKPHVLLASSEDWGWTRETGARVDDAIAPDPLLAGWLAEQRGAIWRDDQSSDVPPDLAPLLEQLFAGQDARALVTVRSHDELLGLVVVPTAIQRLRGRALEFVERVAERLAEALIHARMARRAADAAALTREVELAATVQEDLLPKRGPHVFGGITVVGSWRPATHCAGDFWGVYPLAEGRVLVTIGDVTGHGVASAMVTAAAIGACDTWVRRTAGMAELTALAPILDAAVRRVGGGHLAMTAFAAILDPAAGDIAYVSCGHTVPYLCRAKPDGAVDLQALVGRGNPLGTGSATVAKVQHRALQPGDLIVCYTDGVVDAEDPAGKQFGDRRLQLLLKKLDRARLAAPIVHDLVQANLTAHRAGQPLADDETVVVAQLAQAE